MYEDKQKWMRIIELMILLQAKIPLFLMCENITFLCEK